MGERSFLPFFFFFDARAFTISGKIDEAAAGIYIYDTRWFFRDGTALARISVCALLKSHLARKVMKVFASKFISSHMACSRHSRVETVYNTTSLNFSWAILRFIMIICIYITLHRV